MGLPSVPPHADQVASARFARAKVLTPVSQSTGSPLNETTGAGCEDLADARVRFVAMLRRVHRHRNQRGLAEEYQTNRENVRRWHHLAWVNRRPMPAAALLLCGNEEFEAIVAEMKRERAAARR